MKVNIVLVKMVEIFVKIISYDHQNDNESKIKVFIHNFYATIDLVISCEDVNDRDVRNVMNLVSVLQLRCSSTED